jgi:hypothetical protein
VVVLAEVSTTWQRGLESSLMDYRYMKIFLVHILRTKHILRNILMIYLTVKGSVDALLPFIFRILKLNLFCFCSSVCVILKLMIRLLSPTLMGLEAEL